MAQMHEIDYQIIGEDMQFVKVELDPGEAAIAEAGMMMYIEDGIQMDTVFGDGSAQNKGFMGALMGAGKRLLTGESLFTTVFHNESQAKRKVAFAAPYPGRIMPVHLAESPLTCVAVGSGRSLEEFEAIHRSNRSRARRRNGNRPR